jgi:hypothetical protein
LLTIWGWNKQRHSYRFSWDSFPLRQDHFHLLRDIGKDLFEAEYRQLQQELSRKKIYARLRYQLKAQEESSAIKKGTAVIFRAKKSSNI